MSVTAHRNLARLPLSIYENLGRCYRHQLTRDSTSNNNNQDTNDKTNDYNDDDQLRPHDHDVTKKSRIYDENIEIKSNCYKNDPEILKKLIISKLIQYFRQTSIQDETSGNSTSHEQQINQENSTIQNKKKKNILTVGDFLQLSAISLLKILDPFLTYDECHEFYRRVCLYCAPHKRTALQLWHNNHHGPSTSPNPNQLNNHHNEKSLYNSIPSSSSSSSSRSTTHMTTNGSSDTNSNHMIHRPLSPGIIPGRHLSTGIKLLDHHLRGGIRIGTITELFGKAGTGKTQIAFQIAIREAMTIGGGSTIYIDTERKVSLSRLREMVVTQLRQKQILSRSIDHNVDEMHDQYNQNHNQQLDANIVLQNFMVHSPQNMNKLLSVLDFLEEEISNQNWKCTTPTMSGENQNICLPVRLIVLDSIAAPTRHDFSSNNNDNNNNNKKSAATIVLQIAQKLKQLATQFNLAILVINQCTNANTSTTENQTSSINQNHTASSAALGTSWHHCVSSRIQLEQVTQLNDNNSTDNNQQHYMIQQANREYSIRILKSNVVGPSNGIGFRIETSGVIGTTTL